MLNWLYDIFKWIYDLFFSTTGNFILSAILMTIVMRMIMLPFDLKTNKSTRKQMRLQPVIDEINRKYANDPERKNQKTMELYKKEKFNPLSGCLPLLLTWPLFIVVFGTLRRSAGEQAIYMFQTAACGILPEIPKFLWIHNVWQADSFLNTPVIPQLAQLANMTVVKGHSILTPENIAAVQAGYDTVMRPLISQFSYLNNGWFILPLLCAGISLLTVKLNPLTKAQNKAPANPNNKGAMNAKMMQYMGPVVSLMVCSTSSTVFAFYWLTSNLWEMGKQLILNRNLYPKETEANP